LGIRFLRGDEGRCYPIRPQPINRGLARSLMSDLHCRASSAFKKFAGWFLRLRTFIRHTATRLLPRRPGERHAGVEAAFTHQFGALGNRCGEGCVGEGCGLAVDSRNLVGLRSNRPGWADAAFFGLVFLGFIAAFSGCSTRTLRRATISMSSLAGGC